MQEIKWITEKRKISELIPTENNPRILTEKQKKDLEKSIKKFDLAEIPAINTNNKILAGHMRLKVLQELKGDVEIDVRVPSRELTEKEAQEYLVRSNKNTGSFDFDMLANEFEVEELKDWGFEDFELGLGVSGSLADEWSGMPEFDQADKESYRYIIVHFDNEKDVEAFFNIIKQKCTDKTKSIWFPYQAHKDTKSKSYE